jgi:hypothetical protein
LSNVSAFLLLVRFLSALKPCLNYQLRTVLCHQHKIEILFSVIMIHKKISMALLAVLVMAASSSAKFRTGASLFYNDVNGKFTSAFRSEHISKNMSSNIAPDANGIIYVKQGGTGDGSSWANAIGDLKLAINQTGVKEVWVAKGEYQPASNTSFSMKQAVKIYGGFPNTGSPTMSNRNYRTQETILKGNGSSVISNNTLMNANAVLDGFTITQGINNTIYGGGGILNQSSASPAIINCTFKANTATRGGGLANFSSSPTITNCVFLGNVGANSGGGIYNENAMPVIKACVFSGNSVTNTQGNNGGGAIFNTGTYTLANISDCLFNANVAEYGAAIRNSFTSNKNQEIINCTFYNNRSSGGAIYNSFTTMILVNTILWGSTQGDDIKLLNSASPVFKYSLQKGTNITTDGNLDGTLASNDPQFVNAANPAGADGFFGTADDGLALKKTSLLISRGSNTLYGANLMSNKDVAGSSRLQKGGVDLGAYESAYAPIPLPDANGVVYVRENGSGNFLANTWDNATAELADALVAAKNNIAIKEIWVSGGNYKPLYSPTDNNFGNADGRNNAFLLVNNVKLLGGFPALGIPLLADRNPTMNPTVLSGDLNNSNSANNGDIYHVLISSGGVGTALLDGFTVKNGFAVSATTYTVNGQVIQSNAGGGLIIYNGNPAINNCIFETNIAGIYGGAIANYSASPTFSNVVFRNNESQSGGAIYNEKNSSPTIFNSLFYDNDANYGVDIQNYDANSASETAPIIYNSTFYSTKNNSKIYNDGDKVKPKIYNSILWGSDGPIENVNSWDSGNGLAVTTVANSIVQGGFNGVANLNSNPLFTNQNSKDFTLTAGSPAKNAGSNVWFTNLTPTTTDLAGNLRLEGGTIDIGAYEIPSVLPVTFGEFIATKQLSAVRLQWQTFSETNNSAFVIKRSTNGKDFSEVGRVASKGNSNSLTNYTHYDTNPSNGLNYYQLQQVDIDGTLTTLGYQTINFSLAELALKVYPNPATDVINVSLEKNIFKEAKLINIYGQQLISKRIADENLLTFELSTLPKGIYFIELTGAKKESLKLVKN